MNAVELFHLVRPALQIADRPTWPIADVDGNGEMLIWRETGDIDEQGWVLCPIDAGSDAVPPPSDDDLPMAATVAAALIADHLRQHLLARGWQVQAHVRRSSTTWRLVDCLSPIDGGGDRLDAEYPSGTDELEVICRSVIAVHTDIRRR